MTRRLVYKVEDVKGFSPPGTEDVFESRLLIDEKSVGAKAIVMNHFTLKPGKRTEPGRHPEPYDEVYYVLGGVGLLSLGDPPTTTEIGPGTVGFIPGGTLHALENTGQQDLKLITVMPGPMVEGVNPLYDERLRRWGTSFKFVDPSE